MTKMSAAVRSLSVRETRLAVRLTLALAGLAVALLLGGTALGQGAAGDEAGAPEVLQFRAEISDVNSLIAWVTVSLSDEARVQIEYWNEGAGRFRARLSEPAVNHYLPVVRLRAATTYQYSIGVEGPDGEVVFKEGDGGEFTTGELPELLQRFTEKASGRSTQQLILGDYLQSYLVFWDDEGQIVWYYPTPERGGPQIAAIQQKPNRNLLWEAWACCLREVSPTAEQVAEYHFGNRDIALHHDFWQLDDGRILSIAEKYVTREDPGNLGEPPARVRTPPNPSDRTAPEGSFFIVADVLVAWDTATGDSEQVWDALDFFEVDVLARDQDPLVAWSGDKLRVTHANSIQMRPRGNVIMSMRTRSQVISISPDFQSIEWRLGGAGSDYTFPDPSDRFYGQHVATQLPNGNVLVFDNGLSRPREHGGMYSRALELRLDEETKTAVKVWEYREDPDYFVLVVGSAYRTRNGNTLVNFGVPRQAWDPTWTERTPIVLVEADAEGREIFRLETSGVASPSRYRAYGDIDSIMGEVRLPSPGRPQPGIACMGDDDDLCVQTIPQPPTGSGVAVRRSFTSGGARFRVPADGPIHDLNLSSLPLDEAGKTAEPMPLCLPDPANAQVAMLARYSAEDGQWELLQGAMDATGGPAGGGICGLVDQSGRYAVVETGLLSAGLDGTRVNSYAVWRAGTEITASELLGALAGRGVRALYWRDGTAWQGYAAPIDDEPVPGARDFAIRPGAMLWLGG